MTMLLIVGLGNPGSEYDQTRHNVGYMLLDAWVSKHGGRWSWNKQNGWVSDLTVGGTRVLCAKPATYMNLSGEFVSPLAHYFKIAPADVLLLHDDMDLPLGRIRLAQGGGAGGHRGVASIQQHLSDSTIPRFKLGIGHPVDRNRVTDYVLTRFTSQESPIWSKVMEKGLEVLDFFVGRGILDTMNRYNNYNAVPPPPKPPKVEEPPKPGAAPPEGTLPKPPKPQDSV